MKVLFVVARALEINTSSSIRNRAIIQGLVDLGHTVEVVSIQPADKHDNFDIGLRIKGVQYTYFEPSKIASVGNRLRSNPILNKLRVWAYHAYNNIQIYDNTKTWIEYRGKLRGNQYDLIISSSDPKSSHLFVKKCFEENILNNTKWIQIWGDPFALDITLRNKYLIPFIKKEEAKLLRAADKIFYVSRLTLEEQKLMYPESAKKMESMYIPYTKEKIYDEGVKREFQVAYCGDYTSNIRNIYPLYEALVEEGYKGVICGNTDIVLENNSKVKVSPRVGVKELDKIEEDSTVLVHLSNLKGTQIPGKINHYSATNKTILFILDGDQKNKKLLEEEYGKYNRYVFCNNSKEDIKQSLEMIKSNKYKVINKPVQEFKADNVTKDMLNKVGVD